MFSFVDGLTAFARRAAAHPPGRVGAAARARRPATRIRETRLAAAVSTAASEDPASLVEGAPLVARFAISWFAAMERRLMARAARVLG